MTKPERDSYNDSYRGGMEYYKQLADYWEDRYNCAKAVGDECLFRLRELEEITCENGVWFWKASGEIVGGA